MLRVRAAEVMYWPFVSYKAAYNLQICVHFPTGEELDTEGLPRRQGERSGDARTQINQEAEKGSGRHVVSLKEIH